MNDLLDYERFLLEKFKPIDGDEPFDLDSEAAAKRGALLITAFDDRKPELVAKSRREGNYVAPDWSKGEVGLALAFNSPHDAVRGSNGVVEWGVHLRGDGDGDDVVIENLNAQG